MRALAGASPAPRASVVAEGVEVPVAALPAAAVARATAAGAREHAAALVPRVPRASLVPQESRVQPVWALPPASEPASGIRPASDARRRPFCSRAS